MAAELEQRVDDCRGAGLMQLLFREPPVITVAAAASRPTRAGTNWSPPMSTCL